MLVWEKLLLHVDGAGDSQWADILHGTRVEIPRLVSEFRKQENILRLLVANSIAYHCTMPLRYLAESSADRRSRDKAIVDTLWANHLAQNQDFNGLFAEAMFLAMPAGFSPVHAYWREDIEQDWYEPTQYGQDGAGVSRGMLDCWVGNPFTHVFDRGAKRGSIRWSSYERVLPADMVRSAFAHVPGIAGLQGSTRMPSTAEFQRIARSWQMAGLGVHGSPVINHRRGDDDELIALICRETAPGVLVDWPKGRLEIIAVPADERTGEGVGGHALLVADQPLPAGDYSWSLFYSDVRASDVHGKPWVEDLDQLQVDLNIALSKRWEFVNRAIESPIIAPGGAIGEDMIELDGYSMIEVEPSLANWRPKTIEFPQWILMGLDKEIEEKRRALYTGGGYQAASRGESPGTRTPYRAILALQEADKTVHGPVNMRFKRSACDFMARCHRQMKAYGDVPWLIEILDGEFAHLAEPYVDNAKLSDSPRYKLVNAFGPSPEARAQEILQLAQMTGADGEPFLTTREARKLYPNPVLFDDSSDPVAVQRRRAKTIATQFHTLAQRFRAENGFEETDPSHPWVQQAATQVFYQMEQRFPRLRDDDLYAHLAALSEITQDETSDPIARAAARQRQALYYDWQAMGAGQPTGDPRLTTNPGNAAGGQGQRVLPGRREVAAEMMGGQSTQ